jgi:hypothetical protein
LIGGAYGEKLSESQEEYLSQILKGIDDNFEGNFQENSPLTKLERAKTAETIIMSRQDSRDENREDKEHHLLLPILPLRGIMPDVVEDRQLAIYKTGLRDQGVHPGAIVPLSESYKKYLNFPRSMNVYLSDFYFRVESYKRETFRGEEIPDLDYASAAAIIKYLTPRSGKLRYLPEAIYIFCETCFIHIPQVYGVNPDQSLIMFKMFMRLLYNEQYDLGLGMDYAIRQDPTTVPSLELLRGVRGNNASYFKSLQEGAYITIPTLTSATTSMESALRFTDQDNKVIVKFRLGTKRSDMKTPQLIPGFVVSGSLFEGHPSEWEVLLSAGLYCKLVEIQKTGDVTYYIVDIEGIRKSQDPVNVLKNINQMTLADLNTIREIERESLQGETLLAQSEAFLTSHYGSDSLFGRLIDHMSGIYKEVTDPNQVLGNRLYRTRTFIPPPAPPSLPPAPPSLPPVPPSLPPAPPSLPPAPSSLQRSNTVPVDNKTYSMNHLHKGKNGAEME